MYAMKSGKNIPDVFWDFYVFFTSFKSTNICTFSLTSTNLPVQRQETIKYDSKRLHFLILRYNLSLIFSFLFPPTDGSAARLCRGANMNLLYPYYPPHPFTHRGDKGLN